MKIEQLPAVSGVGRYRIVFETNAERALTKFELMTLIDNCEGQTYDWRADSYRLNGRPFGQPQHGGGFVRGLGPDTLEIEIQSLPECMDLVAAA